MINNKVAAGGFIFLGIIITMLRLLCLSLVLVLTIYPFAYMRKNLITHNEFFGIFLGNYIYFSICLLLVMLALLAVHLLVKKMTVKQIMATSAAALVIAGVVGYYNYRVADVIQQQIVIAKPAEVSSLRLAFISDLHLNSNSNRQLFVDAVSKINQAKVDLVFVGGDLLQDSYRQVSDDYQAVFSQLEASLGKYLVMGNHEYYSEDVEGNIDYIESLGFTVIRDALLTVNGVQFVVRDDTYNQQRLSLAELYQTLSIDPAKPIVVLDHNPASIQESRQLGADLQLSGHTHAGQFFPFNVMLDMAYDNARGYKQFDQLHTIVSEGLGVGYWRKVGPWQMPYRLGTNSQINIIDLRFM